VGAGDIGAPVTKRERLCHLAGIIAWTCSGREAREDLDLSAWRGLHPNVQTTLLEAER